MHADIDGDKEEGVQEYLSSTPGKPVSGACYTAIGVNFPSMSTLKRFTGVALVINQGEELIR